MAKNIYIGIYSNLITNSGNPFTNTVGWIKNQDVTLSIEDDSLKVVSNQDTSTPGIYYEFGTELPAGTYDLTCRVTGSNVPQFIIRAYSSGNSESSDIYRSSSSLSTTAKNISETVDIPHPIKRIYLFMNGMSLGSYFKVSKFYFNGSVCLPAKCLYIGVNNVARKVKKCYIGVNNVARLFYDGYNVVNSIKIKFNKFELHTIDSSDKVSDSYTVENSGLSNYGTLTITESSNTVTFKHTAKSYYVAIKGDIYFVCDNGNEILADPSRIKDSINFDVYAKQKSSTTDYMYRYVSLKFIASYASDFWGENFNFDSASGSVSNIALDNRPLVNWVGIYTGIAPSSSGTCSVTVTVRIDSCTIGGVELPIIYENTIN